MSETAEQLEQTLEILRMTVQDGDILVLRADELLKPQAQVAIAVNLRMITKHLRRQGKDVTVIVVPQGWDLESLDEAQMLELGWVRA